MSENTLARILANQAAASEAAKGARLMTRKSFMDAKSIIKDLRVAAKEQSSAFQSAPAPQ